MLRTTLSKVTATALAALLMIGSPAVANAAEPAETATAPATAAADAETAPAAEEPAGDATEPVPEAESAEQPAAPVAETPTAEGPTSETAEPTEQAATDDETAAERLLSESAGLKSRMAAVTAEQLAAGTYTISANLYVAGSDAPIGVNAYLTDGGFPPINPQNLNAKLVVDADGDQTLTLPVVQQIFTLQHIGDTSNATILNTLRGGTIQFAPDGAAYSDRLTELTIGLGDSSGYYVFSDVIEYPSILNTEKQWPLHLSVDFAGAVRQLDVDFTQSYTDEATGITVTVNAEAASAAIPLLTGATLSATEISEGSERANAEAVLGRAYATQPEFTLYELALTSGGQTVELDSLATATVSIPTPYASASVQRIDPASAISVSSTLASGEIEFEVAGLGAFAVVDDDTAQPWDAYKHLASSEIDGLSLTMASTNYIAKDVTGLDFPTADSYGVYHAFFGQLTSGEFFDSASGTVSDLNGFAHPELRGLYELGFDMSTEAFPLATQKHAYYFYFGSQWETLLSGTVPASSPGAEVYLVSGTVGEGATSVRKLDSTISGGVASFTIVPIDELLTGSLLSEVRGLWNAASGWDGSYDTALPDDSVWTDSTLLSYIAVVDEAPIEVDKPTAATGLVYNGKAQTGVAAGQGYTFSATSVPAATAAGTYAVEAALEPGYVWSDGTTAPVRLVWTIAELVLEPGTYQVSANMYVPGVKNDILGLTAYITNPKNPLEPDGSPLLGLPLDPVEDNATMVVKKDGTRTVTIPLPNPVFTLIGLGTGEGATAIATERDDKAYGTNADGRITSVTIELDGDAGTGMFAASHIYAVPLQMNKTWDLHFDVDFASAVKTSDETGETEGGGDGGEGNGSGNNHGGTGTGNTGGSSTKPQPIPTVDGTLQAGTYTVSANVWLSREVTGLPLDPHLTSGEFPPMNPVTNNATLVVDANGNGTVTAPILIQSRIMTVRSITGNGVSTSGGSSVSSVTVNLGKIASTDSRITRPVTASVSIGELAMSIGGPIFGGTTEHTWPATFELNISGVPTSGGGTMPAWAVASLTDTTTAQADQAAADAALEAARKANERSKLAAEKAAATELAEAEAEQDGAQAALFWAGGVLLLLIAAGGITIWRVRSRAAESLTKDVL